MSDSLFECTYTDSFALLCESYSKVRYKAKIAWGWYFLCFAVLIFAWNFWVNHWLWPWLALASLLRGIYDLLLPAIAAQNVMQTIKKANRGDVPSARIVLSDKITHYYKLDTCVILYADLQVAYFLKKSIVFASGDAYVTFDRKGFTKGTPEELERFLREKHPHVKIFSKH